MIGWIILALLIVLIAVILIRTLMFKPKPEPDRVIQDVSFDEDAAVNALAELVKCKTVSEYDSSLEDDKEFKKLLGKLPKLYPNVFKTCEYKEFDNRGILFRWKGTEEGDPAIFMAHYDVVPVEEENWTRPAFDALIEDGIMWGRGTLDTKNTFNGVLSAGENLIKQGFTPKNDIYFAFSGGEEVNGPGARNIVAYFKEQGITPSMVLDEGGAVVDNIFPGVTEPCGLIGIAEKGMMNLRFDFAGAGGHASAPAPHTPVGRLSKACCKLEDNPPKMHLTKPVLEMFDVLGRRSTFLYRMIFANLWCFKGVLDLICKKSGGELNALVRTTTAFTMMNGSKAPNVIPPSASMVANFRVNPVETIESAKAYVEKTINDKDITVTLMNHLNPSVISRTDVDGWYRVRNAVVDTWTGAIAAPYLMVQCSDSTYYSEISDRVYRFSAADMTEDERHSIHGNDEHIRISTIKKAVEFFIRVMKEC